MTTDLGEALDRTIGSYVLRRKLADGGMGTVYVAEHASIGKRVAIKVLHQWLASKPAIVQRLLDEAKAVNAIQHPNIVDIIDFGRLAPLTSEGAPLVYLVMELLSGVPLDDLIEREAPLGPERTIAIALQIADALAAAHRVRIIHRDLKPGNVLLLDRCKEEPNFVKLLDFGIAKHLDRPAGARLTRTGTVIGTPLYMSPEQCRGRDDIDLRTDIYALGVVVYEMLTGTAPFSGEGLGEILVQQMAMPPLAPSLLDPQISPHLELVVLKALEKQRADRYESMDEMAAALRDPVSYVEARGGLKGFLRSPISRDPDRSSAGAAIEALSFRTPSHGVVTTLHSAAAQPVPRPAAPSARRRMAMVIGAGLLVGASLTASLVPALGRDGASSTLERASAAQTDVARETSPVAPSPPAPLAAAAKAPEAAPEPAPVIAIEMVPVTIDSTPVGATVSINGVEQGLTPYRGDQVRRDTPVEVKLALAGYEPVIRKIALRSGVVIVIALDRARPPPRPGRDGVTTDPDRIKNPFATPRQAPP